MSLLRLNERVQACWTPFSFASPGDTRILQAAQQQIRTGFREKASLAATDPSVQPALQHAEEVAVFLRTNLVQGKKEDNGIYSMCRSALFFFISPRALTLPGLRIHDEIERGDNDTVNMGDGQTIKIDGKTCADR